MTDDELKQLVASLAIAQQETDRLQKETSRELRELAQQAALRQEEATLWQEELARAAALRQEEAVQWQEELARAAALQQEELARAAALRQEEAVQRQKELAQAEALRQEKADKRQKKADKRKREIDLQLKELGKQIGGLGKKFGSFTEGLALPSMTKILKKRFKMEVINPSVRVDKHGINAEIDVLAYANSDINEVYVVEVKSHLREEGIVQLKQLMANFRMLFPEHRDKKLYGIIAAVDVSDALKKRVLASGFYMARIQDETFRLDTPDGFQAKCF